MVLDDFLPYILPFAKGCPAIIATFATRAAIIELCQKASVWREYQPTIATVLNQTAYANTPATGQQVCTLLSLTLDGQDIDVVAADIGKDFDRSGTLRNYCYGTFTGFELRPAPVAGQSVITYSAVAPSLTATTVPDAFGQYVEGIAQGSLQRILATKDKEYSNGAGAGLAAAQWAECIADAKSDAARGFARATSRTSKVWF